MGNKVPLSIVRRGTSLARIDRQAAGALHIDVLNTPGVNALFVAHYMLKQFGLMLTDGAIPAGSKRIAVIGSGGIGARVQFLVLLLCKSLIISGVSPLFTLVMLLTGFRSPLHSH
jgi:lactate dehydrogenase-like 2-hydroxyacid dehydrogenase